MQKMLFFFGIIILQIQCNNNHEAKSGGTDQKAIIDGLQTLLKEKNFFKLETEFEKNKSNISRQDSFYFHAFIDEAFNNVDQAIQESDSVVSMNVFPDSVMALLAALRSDCYFKNGIYRQAANEDSLILNKYHTYFPKNELDDIENKYLLHTALIGTPPATISKSRNDTLHWMSDKLGLMEIQVKTSTGFYNSIFDTHANICSISKSYAARLGLRILNGSYKEGSGITGISFETGIGVADSIYIGHILLRNVVFQVMPDSILYIKSLNYSMNILTGLNVIAQLGEIDIYKNNRMIIPYAGSKSTLHNLALNGLKPVISLKSGDDTLSFDFDSGASGTEFYAAYFRKYKDRIVGEDSVTQILFGGAGGERKMDIYVIPKVELVLGNQKAILDSIGVLTIEPYEGQRYYGNIGQDFIRNFDELTINFSDMYVESK